MSIGLNTHNIWQVNLLLLINLRLEIKHFQLKNQATSRKKDFLIIFLNNSQLKHKKILMSRECIYLEDQAVENRFYQTCFMII
jgi:hypothetical protein